MAKRERDEELSGDKDILDQLQKLGERIAKGFDDQKDRCDQTLDNWEMYNCILGRKQNFTSDKSQLYIPIVRKAVDALATRYVNQAFPTSGRHVECITGEVDQPYALLSLLEHNISIAKLRTGAARSLLIRGQVEGQYNAYFHRTKISRRVVSLEEVPVEVDGAEVAGETILEATEEEIHDEYADIEVLADNDIVILPATAPSPEAAVEMGGCVAIIRHWSEAKIDQMIDDGEIDEDAGQDLIDKIGQGADSQQVRDADKANARAAGIYISRGKMFALVWEVWTKLKIDDERLLCRAFYSAEKEVVGCKRNPYWNDRLPIRSAQVKKLPGVAKGEAPVSICETMQIAVNDLANQSAEQDYYVNAPAVMADPVKVSKWKDLVADVGAVWPVDPSAVKMFEWPNKSAENLQKIAAYKAQIFETLEVNSSMIPGIRQSTKKPTQAEIAQEQQVDLLMTADAVTVLEEEILTPWAQWAAETDHQFRDKDIVVREFGELGMEADIETIPPIQWGKRWSIRWVGVEMVRNAAMLQQMISWVNVLKEIPPDQLKGYQVDLTPLAEFATGQICGARIGRLVLRREQSVQPTVENEMLEQGFDVLTHAVDNDAEHLQAHVQLFKTLAPGTQAHQKTDMHIQMHQRAMVMKQQAAAALSGGQAQAAPQGRRTAQGPRPGAQAAPPRQGFGPPGGVRPDAMAKAGATPMPRGRAA